MTYPHPHNPYVGRELDEVQAEIFEGCKRSWEVASSWRVGDMAIYWTQEQGTKLTVDAMYSFLDSCDMLDDIKPEGVLTIAEVCLAFPGPVRDLDRTFSDHYYGWLLATHPDGVRERIEQMKQSGEYDD